MSSSTSAAGPVFASVAKFGFQFRPYAVTTTTDRFKIPPYQLVLCQYDSWTSTEVNGVPVPVDLKPCNIKAGLRWVQLMGLDNDPSLVDLGVTPGCEKHVQKYLTAVNESARKQQRGNVFDFDYDNLRRNGLKKGKKRPAVDEAEHDSRLAKVLKSAPVRAIQRAFGSKPQPLPTMTTNVSIDFLGPNRPPSAASVFLGASHKLLDLARSTHETAGRYIKDRELVDGPYSTMSGVELAEATDTLERGVRRAVADALDTVPRAVSMMATQTLEYLDLRELLDMDEIVHSGWKNLDLTSEAPMQVDTHVPPLTHPSSLAPRHRNFGRPLRRRPRAASRAVSPEYAQPSQSAHGLVQQGYNPATFGFLGGGGGNDDRDSTSSFGAAGIADDSPPSSPSLEFPTGMGQLGQMLNVHWEHDE